MLKFYHNNRCSKCRTSLEYVKEHSKELTSILNKLGKSAFEMVRTHEKLYKEKYKGLELTNDEWIDILVENPQLIKRPIIVSETGAVWAVPAEEVLKLSD